MSAGNQPRHRQQEALRQRLASHREAHTSFVMNYVIDNHIVWYHGHLACRAARQKNRCPAQRPAYFGREGIQREC